MILGIGTDIVQVDRFKKWAEYPKERLLKLFSEQELNSCIDSTQSSVSYKLESLASRFAAKEAFFKAFSQALVKLKLNKKEFSLFFTCANVELIKGEWDLPVLKVNGQAFEDILNVKLPTFCVDVSISHESLFAVSIVVISSID